MSDLRNRIAGLSPEKQALMALRLKQKQSEGTSTPTIPHRTPAKHYRLSFAQQRLWFLDQLEPNNPAYNVPIALRLRGPLDAPALERAITELIARHESLRTSFASGEGDPVQIIHLPQPFHLTIHQLSEEAVTDSTLIELAADEARLPFDLASGSLLRAKLIRLSETDHVVLVTIHHIVFDGWSAGIFIRELGLLYHAFARGEASPLPKLAIQYADFAEWQRGWLTGETLQKQLDFWKDHLGQEHPLLELPTDFPRPAIKRFQGATQTIQLSRELLTRLKQLASETDATLFMTLLAAFQTLLFRYTGQTDIRVGTPISGRTSAETKNIIGLFANTLVLRAELSEKPTFRQLLAKVRQTTLDAFAHQDLPFEKLVEELQPERDLSRTALFQTLFVFKPVPKDWQPGGQLKFEHIQSNRGAAKFDLTLTISERPHEFLAAFEYDTDLFTADTIRRMLNHFQNLLGAIVANPDQAISRLVMLSPAELNQLTEDWNQTDVAFPPDECLHQLFEAQAAQHPDWLAVVAGDDTITFAELNTRADALAAKLQSLGVGPEVFVGLAIDRSVEMFVGLLGILKAGGAYVPIDPTFPAERIQFILADTQAPVVVTQSHLVDQPGLEVSPSSIPHPPSPIEDRGLSHPGYHTTTLRASEPILDKTSLSPVVICLDKLVLESRNPDFHTRNPEPGTRNPASPAYVLYTSGSTGQPKGVVVEHRHLLNYLRAIESRCGLESGMRYAMVQPLTVDSCKTVVFPPLCLGGTVYVFNKDQALSAGFLVKKFQEHEIEVLKIAPSHLAALQAAGNIREILPRKRLILGGESSTWAWMRTILAELPSGCRVFNHYGPTETTVAVLSYEVDPHHPETDRATLPLGRPLANCRMHVLDQEQQPVPVGVPGELYISGACVSRGYLNLGDRGQGTGDSSKPVSSAFSYPPSSIPHPLYRTGDLVRYRPDGVLEFLGRTDLQVKIRGYRIELGEVEAALRQHPAVREAVVIAREDIPGDRRLLAYVTLHPDSSAPSPQPHKRQDKGFRPEGSLFNSRGAKPTEYGQDEAQALQDFLRTKLPDFMQPAAIVVLEKLPLAAQGKVALKALPAPEYGAMGPASAHTIPTTPTEELIAQIWAEVLGRDTVPIDAGFFELGGHSLLAVRVLARMRDAFQVELPLRRLFEVQTVTGIAAVIDELVAQQRRGEPLNQQVPPPLVAGPRPDQLPLSFSQERFWFLDQLEPGNTFYLVPAALHLRGELSLPALERAFQEVARRHEDLRTVFRIADSQPVQVIFPEWPWGEIVRFESVVDRETAIQSVRADIKRPFDLANGPMLRVKVLQFSPEDWILLIVLHHTVADGWSLNVLTREVAQLYSAFVREEQKNLPPLPVQYADYALWQRNWFSGEVLQDQLSFWTKTLGNVAKVLELPTDFPRPAIQEYRGANQRIEFPPELTQALRALSRREGVTLFMTLLAGFHLLLHRYAGQEDILIGTPVAGRNRREIEGLIGVFVNILVLHGRLSADLSFRDLLKQVRETTLDAFAHQDLPFEQLLEALHLPRDLSRSPLFQVFFVYQNAFTPLNLNLKLGDLELIPFRNSGDVISGVSRYDLSLFVVETRDSVRFVFQYSTALFQAETIQRMMGHFQTLFESVVANPTAPLSELNLLTAAEREQLLVEWNATQAEYPAQLCLHQLVEQQVEQTPDAIAVRFGAQRLTYRELNLRAEILAAELGLQDIGPGDRVGVCLERGLEMLVAVLGVLKSGAAYVPLDPAFPTERLELIITDAQLAAIVTQFSVVDRLPVIAINLLYVDDLDWRPNPGTLNPEPRTLNPGSPAYVIYTSGSTGRPKGVVIPHRAVVNFLCSMQRQPGLTPQDRLLAVTTLSFDIAGLELFLPLVTGACVVIASQDATRDGVQLAQLLSDESITVMQATPATWKLLLESGWNPSHELKILCGGEALSRDLADQLLAGGGEVWNLYGPTETTIWSTLLKVEPGSEPISIGRPIANTQALILDAHQQPVPIGVVGELYLGGDGVALGYWQRPELTAERFALGDRGQGTGDSSKLVSSASSYPPSSIPHPLYRTGDLARWRPDGTIEFLGRNDFQVKLRGYRIELGEIEAAFRHLPAVKDAVVLAREDFHGNKRLVAYVLSNQEHPALAEQIQTTLRTTLPDYMIPSALVVLEAFPLTPNGKIDRLAFPAPEQSQPETDKEPTRPKNSVEERLVALWSQVLNRETVGVDEDFFELGGHSLLGMQLMIRIRQAFHIELPLRKLFELPTIVQLAAEIIEAQTQQTAQGALPPLTPAPRTDALPLSFAQERLWFIDQLQPGSPLYIIPAVTQLQGEFPLAKLEQAFTEIIRRHEVLRTTFAAVDGKPVQIIHPPSAFHFEVLTAEKPEDIRPTVAEFLRRPFDLSTGPLIRAGVVKPGVRAEKPGFRVQGSGFTDVESETFHQPQNLEFQETFNLSKPGFQTLNPEPRTLALDFQTLNPAPQPLPPNPRPLALDFQTLNPEPRPLALDSRTLLCLAVHHIVFDGWSIGVLQRELAAILPALAQGLPSPLPPLAVQYADFAAWQRQWLTESVLANELTFWQNQLADLPPLLELPTDRPRPAVKSFRGAKFRFEIPETLVMALREINRSQSATSFMVLLTAFQTLLARYTGQSDIFVGTPVANRTTVETEKLIGFFVNTLVLRTDLSGDPTFHEAVNRVKQVSLAAFAHQNLPFEKLVEALQPERNLSHTPLFQVAFVYGQQGPQIARRPQAFEAVEVPVETAKFDLTLNLVETGNHFAGTIEYSLDLFEQPTIARLAGHFLALLERAATSPDLPISQLPLLTAAERQAFEAAWVAELPQFEQDRCLHTWFAEQAARTPDAIAVSIGKEPDGSGFKMRMTYRKLNELSNRLAIHLQSLGVKPETLVVLCCERSLDLMIGILGILKAGGAYVPVDPNYPTDRISFILNDTQSPVVVTQSHLLDRIGSAACSDRGLAHPGYYTTTLRASDPDSEDFSPSSILQPPTPIIVCLDKPVPVSHTPTPDPRPLTPDPRPLTPDASAYVIYTSGSTGNPKGVVVTHRNVVRLFTATDDWFHFGPQDVWTLFHSFAFDFSVWELWGALLYGGKLVVVPYLTSRSPEAFYELLRSEQVTVLNQTPSAFRQLQHEDQHHSPDVLALRLVIFGGEALEPGSLRPWVERHGLEQPQLINMYGITETTVHVTYRPITLQDVERGSVSPIGTAIPDLRLFVLDQHGQPVPVGVPGELYVSGAGVARGYLNRPELTAERFGLGDRGQGSGFESGFRVQGSGFRDSDPETFDQFKNQGSQNLLNSSNSDTQTLNPEPRTLALDFQTLNPEPRTLALYRTGDLVRWLASGELEYLGRIDQQVKIRGFRIELGEIEAALHQHPQVRESVVILREDVPGDRRLVAYVVAQSPESELSESLRAEVIEHLRSKLPDYMVPAAIVFLDTIPLTAHGKVDRKVLPAPASTLESPEEITLPQTQTEEILAALWAEVLGLEQVDIRTSFFDLGGHSLMATQVLSRMKETFEVTLPLRVMFENPTVVAIATAIDEARNAQNAGDETAPPLVRISRDNPLPLSFAQERLWLIDQLEPGRAHYSIPAVFRVKGDLNLDALKQAFRALVERHEILRTTYTTNHRTPVQIIHSEFPAESWTVEPETDPELIKQRVVAEILKPFDLANGPIFRAKIIQLSENEWILAIVIHHVAFDGWSIGVFIRELSALYQAFANGAQPSLIPLPIQYADFAHWQRTWLQGEVLESQLAFWKNQLSGAPTVLELPTDFARPPVQSFKGALRQTVLSPELSTSLKLLARNEQATLFVVLLAVFETLLYRYTGQNDVLVGTPVAGRTRRELEGLIGFFVNTLVMRAQFEPGLTFRQFVAQVRETVVSGLAHQDLPFEKLVEALQPDRDLTRTPLFQVVFVLQNAFNTPNLKRRFGSLEIEPVEAENLSQAGFSKFDLTLIAREQAGSIRLGMQFNTELFLPETIDRMLNHLHQLIENAVATPDLPLAVLPMLSQTERDQLRVEWNPTRTFESDGCLHEWFSKQAQSSPDAVAVVMGDTDSDNLTPSSLTYGELDDRSNQLAIHLQSLGVKPETLVVLCCERSLDLVIGILGILKAGGAYVPVDPNYPTDRISFILNDTQAPVVVTQSHLLDRIGSAARSDRGLAHPGYHTTTLRASDPDSEDFSPSSILHPPTPNPQPPTPIIVCLDKPVLVSHTLNPEPRTLNPDSPAYVIYTSGSTGNPKGVVVTHRNVVRLFTATDDWFHFGPGDVWTLFHSFAFDFSVWELWGALLFGGKLVVVPYLTSRSPETFYHLLCSEQVTVLNQTPSAFRQLQHEDQHHSPDALALRLVIFGGEALEPGSLRPWVERHGLDQPQLINMYGITETTVHVTYRPITLQDVERGSVSPIGTAIPDLQLFVLDQHGQPVPVGVPGELYVSGAGVARGYLNRPELTAQRFALGDRGQGIGDSFASGDREQGTEDSLIPVLSLFIYPPSSIPHPLYRTGDLVRWLASGELEYLGRIDQQVKIRGFRIELGEIEAALHHHPQVRESVVLLREDVPGDRRLVAYVVAQSVDSEPGESLRGELLDHLRSKLPDYMVPAAIVFLDTIPLTAHGKVDRKALPKPEFGSGETVAPATETERQLSVIWAEILHLEQVGNTDNFFDLGGHSLLATQVVSRVREEFNIEIGLRQLFELPTVAQLAHWIDQQIEPELTTGLSSAIVPVPRDQEVPLSFAQERLWFLDQLEPGSLFYIIPGVLRIPGQLHEDALKLAFAEVVSRHESLRTTFDAIDGKPVQIIHPVETFVLPLFDLSQTAAAKVSTDQPFEKHLAVKAFLQTPFDLATGPLIRLGYWQCTPDEFLIAFVVHHIIFDGVSIQVFMRELTAAYRAFRAGIKPDLPGVPVQFADYAFWQRNWLQGDVLETQLAFWKDHLSGAPPLLQLPTDRPRPAIQTFNGAFHSVTLSKSLADALTRLGQQSDSTLYMVLLTAFQTLLFRISNQSDLVVGTSVVGRPRKELEGLIGLFNSNLALRARFDAGLTFRDTLQQVRETVLQAFDHQEVPFEKVVEALRPERNPAYSPIFQVLFNLEVLNQPNPLRIRQGAELHGFESGTAKFDLLLSLRANEAGISGSFQFNTDLFDAETTARWLKDFMQILEQIIQNPQVTLGELTLSETRKAEKHVKKQKDFSRETFLRIKPKTVKVSTTSLVQTGFLNEETKLPLVIRPGVPEVDLAEWFRTHRETVETQLTDYGAILFRDFGIDTVEKFDHTARVLTPDLLQYKERSTPRSQVKGEVYSSTEYPAEHSIPQHNENAYSHVWPQKLWLGCIIPATTGGETPLGDSRRVYGLIPAEIRQEFETKRVMYVRNYGEGLDLSWQTVFQTSDPAEVETYCRRAGIDFEWLGNGRLRTRQVRQAVVKHPKTGEIVWFNQAHLFHVTNLPENVRQVLEASFAPDELPRNAFFGDGTPIDPAALEIIRKAFEQVTIAFPWERGDLVLVDNLLVSHGRRPYTGERQTIVAMAEPMS